MAEKSNRIYLLDEAGISSYISRLLRKGENEQANKTASTALFTSLGSTETIEA